MTETDKRLATYTDEIVHYLERMAEFVEPYKYDYDEKMVEKGIQEIDDKLRFLKQKMVIEHGGMQLTKVSEKHQRGIPKVIVCVETGTVFDSITQAAEVTGINGGNISLAVRGINRTAGGYHWEEFIDTESLPVTKRRPKSISVLCIEDMKEYPSITAASKETGISKADISATINGKQEMAGGLHWRKTELQEKRSD